MTNELEEIRSINGKWFNSRNIEVYPLPRGPPKSLEIYLDEEFKRSEMKTIIQKHSKYLEKRYGAINAYALEEKETGKGYRAIAFQFHHIQ